MFKTKFRLIAGLLAISAIGAAGAQTEAPAAKEASQQKATPATIAEMTKLARELRVATLQKELRDAKEEKKASSAGDAISSGLPVPSTRPVRVTPQAPSVLAIYGTDGVLRAHLASGQDVHVGTKVGIWRVAAIDAGGVSFERCEVTRKGTKKSECEVQFVSPATNG